ncbi:MAG: hypothetical protein KIH69_014755 [Anaerolineae bacterium]|nr:hypothetical protein [Anaerolineae bacterium]
MKTSHRFRAVAHRIGIFVVLALIGAAVFALLGETNATSAQDANRDNPSKVSIPLAKCVGFLACQGINPSLVADGSCNGDFACYGADGPIGAGSCNNNAACGTTFGAIGAGSCNGHSACANAPGAIGNNSCNTTGTTCKGSFVGGTGTFPVGDCQRNDVTPAACLLPPQPTTLPPQPLPPPEQPQALELSVVAFAPVVTVVPTGAATRDTKTYDVVFTIQNVSRIAAPAVLAHLTIPQELKVTSVAWEKEGQFYIDGDLPRKCSFDGLSAYCGIGQLWSGMKASVKLRVTADAGTYTLAIAAQDLSSISEVSNNNQSKSLKLILP